MCAKGGGEWHMAARMQEWATEQERVAHGSMDATVSHRTGASFRMTGTCLCTSKYVHMAAHVHGKKKRCLQDGRVRGCGCIGQKG